MRFAFELGFEKAADYADASLGNSDAELREILTAKNQQMASGANDVPGIFRSSGIGALYGAGTGALLNAALNSPKTIQRVAQFKPIRAALGLTAHSLIGGLLGGGAGLVVGGLAGLLGKLHNAAQHRKANEYLNNPVEQRKQLTALRDLVRSSPYLLDDLRTLNPKTRINAGS